MKYMMIVASLILFSGCQDNLRTRAPKCKVDGVVSNCNTLTVPNEEARSGQKLYATVLVATSLTDTSLTFVESARSTQKDPDSGLACSIDVRKGVKFDYKIKDRKLLLDNGLTQLVLDKDPNDYRDGIEGSWSYTEFAGKSIKVTELIFDGSSHLTMNKTCSILK